MADHPPPPGPIKVLIADDAVVVRRLVSDVLASVPSIEVVGTAINGRMALTKIAQLRPDVLILDVEMPELDGIGTLVELRKTDPRLPVIMFSTLTERGAATTIEALMRGANDYVTKPSNVGGVNAAMEQVRSELVPRIHSLCGRELATSAERPRVETSLSERRSRPVVAPAVGSAVGPPTRVDAIVIGISTGGPTALASLVPALPASLGVPVFIVQHMPPMFTALLAERLDRTSELAVREAVGGEVAEPGTCWIAPGDRHLSVAIGADGRPRVRVDDGPHENSCRPAVDVLFRSAAAAYGSHVLGVVMTGMGQDGLRGSADVVAAGGRVIVQDRATSVVWGMPGAVADGGLADAIVAAEQIPGELLRRVAARRSTVSASTVSASTVSASTVSASTVSASSTVATGGAVR
jgi:two-component system, chemotaxis family, protein-glutamate methylesterase/glutaminase